MKIPASLREAYSAQLDQCQRLQQQVDNYLRPHKHARWHYESRLKSEEGFALKVESGRVKNPAELEDFFAATIVVRNGLEVAEAEKLVTGLFDFAYRKPRSDTDTHKRPDSFPFDDLRLYLRWKDDPTLPPTGLDGSLFELQIKTFLQHAWSIATHDLTYKTDDVNWSTMRIAYQIKAMLEHAEVSIQEATTLAKSDALSKSDGFTASLKEFIEAVVAIWPAADLPDDKRRLADNLMEVAGVVRFNAAAFRAFMEAEANAGRGPKTLNLSPYGAVIQSLIDQKTAEFAKGLEYRAKAPAGKFRPILITREIVVPDSLKNALWAKTTLMVG
jgi:ppGpp synthetase/RelA/SpoT-type nucleotidyltranferase